MYTKPSGVGARIAQSAVAKRNHPAGIGLVFDRCFREDLRTRLAQHGADDPHLLEPGTVVEHVHVDAGEREMVEIGRC